MNIYKYKNANLDNQTVDIEFQYKEPIVFGLVAPDEDYELFEDQNYLDKFVAEKYAVNQTEGQLYKHLISAKITNMVTNEMLTAEQSQIYSAQTKEARNFLSEGYWHSAYFAHLSQTPDAVFQDIHLEVLNYIKDYVNSKYPPNFSIV
jgi:hypothetical protein